MADVNAALVYHLDHRDTIEQQMREVEEFAARLEQEQGPTRFSRLRDQV